MLTREEMQKKMNKRRGDIDEGDYIAKLIIEEIDEWIEAGPYVYDGLELSFGQAIFPGLCLFSGASKQSIAGFMERAKDGGWSGSKDVVLSLMNSLNGRLLALGYTPTTPGHIIDGIQYAQTNMLVHIPPVISISVTWDSPAVPPHIEE